LQFELAKDEVRNKLYASFTAFPRKVGVGEPVTFNNQSMGFSGCCWSYGDGTGAESIEINTKHIYSHTGTYSVELIVFNEKGEREVLLLKNYIQVEAE